MDTLPSKVTARAEGEGLVVVSMISAQTPSTGFPKWYWLTVENLETGRVYELPDLGLGRQRSVFAAALKAGKYAITGLRAGPYEKDLKAPNAMGPAVAGIGAAIVAIVYASLADKSPLVKSLGMFEVADNGTTNLGTVIVPKPEKEAFVPLVLSRERDQSELLELLRSPDRAAVTRATYGTWTKPPAADSTASALARMEATQPVLGDALRLADGRTILGGSLGRVVTAGSGSTWLARTVGGVSGVTGVFADVEDGSFIAVLDGGGYVVVPKAGPPRKVGPVSPGDQILHVAATADGGAVIVSFSGGREPYVRIVKRAKLDDSASETRVLFEKKETMYALAKRFERDVLVFTSPSRQPSRWDVVRVNLDTLRPEMGETPAPFSVQTPGKGLLRSGGPGQLWESADGGHSWRQYPVQSSAAIRWIDTDVGYRFDVIPHPFTYQGVQLKETRDGGATWTPASHAVKLEGVKLVHAAEGRVAFSDKDGRLFSVKPGTDAIEEPLNWTLETAVH